MKTFNEWINAQEQMAQPGQQQGYQNRQPAGVSPQQDPQFIKKLFAQLTPDEQHTLAMFMQMNRNTFTQLLKQAFDSPNPVAYLKNAIHQSMGKQAAQAPAANDDLGIAANGASVALTKLSQVLQRRGSKNTLPMVQKMIQDIKAIVQNVNSYHRETGHQAAAWVGQNFQR